MNLTVIGATEQFALCLCDDATHQSPDRLDWEATRGAAEAHRVFYPTGSWHLLRQFSTVSEVAS